MSHFIFLAPVALSSFTSAAESAWEATWQVVPPSQVQPTFPKSRAAPTRHSSLPPATQLWLDHGRCSLKPCPCEEAPAIAEYYCVPIFTAPLLHYHRPSLSSLAPNSAPVTDDSTREGQYPQVFLAAQLPARTTSRAAVVAQVCMMLHLCAPHHSPTNARTTTARPASSHQHLPTLQRGRT